MCQQRESIAEGNMVKLYIYEAEGVVHGQAAAVMSL